MKTISIINLKGGVAKTLTADSMAHVLATLHNKRVLLVDNDKQGNTSKAFGVHSYDDKSISDVLTDRRLDPREVIKKTRFEKIDVMPANMTLIRANMEVLMDSTRPRQTRLRSTLNAIAEENFYDFCIIDNAPDINISTINALVASDDVIIPIGKRRVTADELRGVPATILSGCRTTDFFSGLPLLSSDIRAFRQNLIQRLCRTLTKGKPRSAKRARRASVKCRPAVGAATLPALSGRAYNV